MEISRRFFFGGIIGALAMPAIIRTPGLVMPVRRIIFPELAYSTINMWSAANIQGIWHRGALVKLETSQDGVIWKPVVFHQMPRASGTHPFRVTFRRDNRTTV